VQAPSNDRDIYTELIPNTVKLIDNVHFCNLILRVVPYFSVPSDPGVVSCINKPIDLLAYTEHQLVEGVGGEIRSGV
jgi:hypothetical protein